MNNTVLVPACADFVDGIASKDVKIGDGSTWVRIFRPEQPPEKQHKLPVVLYTHGGAYSFGQPDWLQFHNFCATMARLTGTIWVSLAYRLAPQHRLPAAYKDALAALRWLATDAPSVDPWLETSVVDYTNTFLCGESTGASIILNVAMNASPDLPKLRPMCVRAVVLIQPGFHTESKRGAMLDKGVGNMAIDTLYDFALPVGENLDYPPVNPIHEDAPPLTPLAAYPNILITTATEDFRYDLTQIFYERVKTFCPTAQLFVTQDKPHVFHLFQPACAETQELIDHVAEFIKSCIVHT